LVDHGCGDGVGGAGVEHPAGQVRAGDTVDELFGPRCPWPCKALYLRSALDAFPSGLVPPCSWRLLRAAGRGWGKTPRYAVTNSL
jgi:hypothetical protein